MSASWETVLKPTTPNIPGLSYLATKINEVLIYDSVKNQCRIYESTSHESSSSSSQEINNGNNFNMAMLSNFTGSLVEEEEEEEEEENDLEIAGGEVGNDNFNEDPNSYSPSESEQTGLLEDYLNDEIFSLKTETETRVNPFSERKRTCRKFEVWESPATARRRFPAGQDQSKKSENELFLNRYFEIVRSLTPNSRKDNLQGLGPHFKFSQFSSTGTTHPNDGENSSTDTTRTCRGTTSLRWEKNEKRLPAALNKSKQFLMADSAMMPSNSSLEESTILLLRGSLTITSTTEAVSPVTLSSDWSRVARLLLLTALSVTGSIGNVFMISAVMIEDHLKKRGNSFLVNIALADILITGLVIPASTVVILADLTDAKVVVCNFQWFLALVSCLVSVLTISATAMENYARLCMSPECYSSLTPCKITAIIILIWLTSCTAVTVQTVLRLGPDYCERTSQGMLPYQITIGVLLVLLPAALACACFSLITFRVRTFKSIPTFRPPVTFTFDYELTKTNMYGFVFFLLFWLPFGTTLALGSVQTISQRVFYSLAWLALSKSCFLNFLYCITNRHFRNAYVNLFHYCCCKTTVSFSRRSREPVRPTGDVRVHIIPGYNMYSYTSPQRSREVAKTSCKGVGTSASCRPVSGRPNGRDIYEL